MTVRFGFSWVRDLGWDAARFSRERTGGVAIYIAFGITALMGFVGLSLDLGTWYASQRDMQSGADAAAIAGALAKMRGENILTVGREAAATYGYTAAEVQVNNPPIAGPYAGNANMVEAIVTRQSSGFVSGMFMAGPATIVTRATAGGVFSAGCVYALNPTEGDALKLNGTTTVNLGCGAQVNSTASGAVSAKGSTCLNATTVATAGGIASGSCINAPSGVATGITPAPDPFAYLSPPPIPGCDYPAGFPHSVVGGTVTLTPGRYCGGIQISGGDITFAPGLYILDEIGLQITGGAVVNGVEVTFYLQPSAFGIAATDTLVNIAGTTATTLYAPTSGPWEGILFYGDDGLDPDLIVKLQGGADQKLQGVIYFPSNDIQFAGGSTSFGMPWTVVVGDTVTFNGDTVLATGTGGLVPPGMPASLLSASLKE